MDSNLKERKLRNYANSVIENPIYEGEINKLFSKLNLTKEEVVDKYVEYDMDIFAYENEIYEPLSMRFVLYLHNLLEGSWHQDRQKAVLEFVKRSNPSSLIDLGFGVPSLYVKEYVLKNKVKACLIDKYFSAVSFGKILLGIWDSSWKDFISLEVMDMNTPQYPGDFELYLFQDSLEHVQNAKDYLVKVVRKSPKDSKFILSLPIGPIVPVHTVEWRTEKEVLDWLKDCGLNVLDKKKVYVNPEVDLFSDQKNYESCNIVVLCTKHNT